MATVSEWNCPICREASGTIAYVGSCLHQFCRSCILRWARKNPSCPLCRQIVHTIIYPAPPDQGFVEMAVPHSSVPHSSVPHSSVPHSSVPHSSVPHSSVPHSAVPHSAVPRSVGLPQAPGAAGPQPRLYVAGFAPETWAHLFRTRAEILRPLELWLNAVLCGACWWDVAFAQGRIVASLRHFGLHEEALGRELQPFLREQTPAFVRQLIQVAADQCGELARRLLAPAPQQSGPGDVARPGTSAAQEPGMEPGQAGARAGASGAVQRGGGGPGGSFQSGRRRGGGAQESRAARKSKRPYPRQN